MTTIYEQHDKAFNNISAYVITDKTGERVATIAFKFPKDGAGRLTAYFHIIGIPMIKGTATGYGYDKRSAALDNAMEKPISLVDYHGDCAAMQEEINRFRAAFEKGNAGSHWDTALREAGYNVLQAV